MKQFLQISSVFAIGMWFGYVLLDNLAPVEPQRLTNMAEYNVKYERCMELVGSESKCVDYAKKESLICVGCE